MKWFSNLAFSVFILLAAGASIQAADLCKGRIFNPVTDLCWGCFFPMKLGGVELSGKDKDNGDQDPPPICKCMTPIGVPRFGVSVSLWEPSHLVEVVRQPMCAPTLGGIQLGVFPAVQGTNSSKVHKNGTAFYQVHHYKYPVAQLLELFTSVLCLQGAGDYSVSWMSEFDLLWDDDQLSMIMNPEAVLFANPVAALACVADSATAAARNFGIESLFWCSGSQGSVYPLTGNVAGHVGGVDSSLNLLHRHLFRQHRIGSMKDTSKLDPFCEATIAPMIPKKIYKEQMVYPIPQTIHGFGLGVPSAIWAAGREFPVAGEDFGYMVWRKRRCCVL